MQRAPAGPRVFFRHPADDRWLIAGETGRKPEDAGSVGNFAFSILVTGQPDRSCRAADEVFYLDGRKRVVLFWRNLKIR